ncbi:hypothetical protein EST38_g3309 [Candolleomyces aberdarensis]|uniref:Fungal-type protein kinase domain-containing protein n=1 Tax=Candolleomyces aberdarensis TaxID=2316362 RepID=A0A4Q2DTD3_9AGAR|nr:hypothetical protein EST38_g3309 [Candolleomyces aberdarensis]
MRTILGGEGVTVEKRYWRQQNRTHSEYGKDIPLPLLELSAEIGNGSSSTLANALAYQTLKSAFAGAWNTYSQHDDRRFYLCLEFSGDTVSLLFYDHYRFARCLEFNIHTEPVLFIRLMAGFMLGPRTLLGQKPSVATGHRGELHLSSRGIYNRYAVIERVYLEERYPSRATAMWRARDTLPDGYGTDLLVKDYWEPLTLDMETGILSEVEEFPGFMKILSLEILDYSDEVVPGLRERVATMGQQAGETPPDMRMRRLVLKPFASPVTSFNGPFELLCAMMDMLNAHFLLFKETGILYRNFAASNMMLYWQENGISSRPTKCSRFSEGIDAIKRQLPPEIPVRSGLLIGLSHAVRLPPDSQSVLDPHCLHGIFLFMAIQLLLQGPAGTAHHVRHDLEAMFWVNCAIGVGYNEEHETEAVSSHPVLKTWDILPSDNGATRPLALRKWDLVRSRENFESKVLAYFLPQFEWLKPIVSQMRDLFFTGDSLDVERDTWHDDMMGILNGATRQLVLEMQSIWDPIPQCQTQTANLGPIEIHLEPAEPGMIWVNYTPTSVEGAW